jgi:hypothetical protein
MTCTGSLEITMRQSVHVRSGNKVETAIKTSVLAHTSFTLDAGSTASIAVELTSAGRRVVEKMSRPLVASATLLMSNGKTSTRKITIVPKRA